MTLLGSLKWHAAPPLWLVVLVIVPAVFLAVRFFYRREAGHLGRRPRIALGLLRVAAILAVLTALFGPFAETVEHEYYKRHLILAVDTSLSMGIRDTYASSRELAARIREAAGYPETADLGQRDRIVIARDLLGSDRAYLLELLDRFHLHVYTFGNSCSLLFEPRDGESPESSLDRMMRQLAELKAESQVTRIGGALHDLVRTFRAKNEPVAGILLLTDGRQTAGSSPPADEAAEAKRQGIPIFPVAIGDPSAAVNIVTSRVDAPEVALADDEVFFTVTVQARGLTGTRSVSAEIVDANGESQGSILSEPVYVDLPEDGKTATASFRHAFGPGRYTLKIGVPPDPLEAVREDNFKLHTLRVVELRMRVLLVTQKPNYTYRFLLPLLQRAEGMIEAQALQLDADPERPQESSEGLPPIAVFPQEKRELAEYDVIILMDVDFNHPRVAPEGPASRDKVLEMLEGWVKRGGGLVLQAGIDGNCPEAYTYPPLNALLPVVPSGLPEHARYDIVNPRIQKRFFLTPAGEVHPILRLLRDPEKVREFWRDDLYATEYYWYAPIERPKSSATVLAYRREVGEWRPSSERPTDALIAIQDYGLGKVLWLGTNELWRMRKIVENRYFWPFWSNAIRHLATYRLLSGNKRIKIWVDRADGRYQVGDSVGIEAKFLDENFEPVEPHEGDETTMTRRIKVRAPSGEETEIPLYAVISDPPEGLFQAKFAPGKAGTYSLIAEPEDRDEEVAEATFIVEDTTLEMMDPLLDLRSLEGIARASDGKVLMPDQFKRLLVDRLVPEAAILRSGEPKRTDLWDRGWVLLLVVGLLAAEWILRRLNLLL
ncbi:MAG TPA: VWA domain-containing protein [Planctomycetota bacterium]|nr:VWA domain-containing protein [Planctomycetota bacterium]